MHEGRHAVTVMLLVCMSSVCVAQSSRSVSEPLAEKTPFANSAFALAIDPSRSNVAVAGRRGDIVVYDAETFAEVTRIAPAGGMVLALSFDATGDYLLVTGDPRRLRIYRTTDWSLKQAIELPFRCGFLDCHPHSPIVVAAGTGNAILFFNFETGILIGKMDQKLERGFEVQFSPNGDFVMAIAKVRGGSLSSHSLIAIDTSLISTSDYRIAIPPFQMLSHSYVGFHSLAVSESGKRFSVTDLAGRIVLFDMVNLRPIQTHAGEFGKGRGTVFVDDETVVSVTEAGLECFGSNQTGLALPPFADHSPSANHLLFDSTRQRLIASRARAMNQITTWRLTRDDNGSPEPSAGMFAVDGAAPVEPSQGFAGPLVTMESLPRGDARVTPAEDANSASGTVDVARSANDQIPKPKQSSGVFIPSEFPAREWTEASSERKLAAQLVGVDGEDVLTWLGSGREAILKRSSLSGEDQQYLRDFEDQYAAISDSSNLNNNPIVSGTCQISSVLGEAIRPDAFRQAKLEMGIEGLMGFSVHGSRPDRRGGFYVMSNLGLGKYHPLDDQISWIVGPPRSGLGMLLPPKPRVEELVVDRFGRAIVCFQGSRNTYRWNGFQWVHLWCSLEGGVQSLACMGDQIFAVLNAQHSLVAKVAKPRNLLLRLDGDRWRPDSLVIDGKPVEDFEQVHPFGKDKLLCIRRTLPPIVVDGDMVTTLDAPNANQDKFSKLTWIKTKVAVTPDERLFYLRQPSDPKSYGRTEMRMVDFEESFVWKNQVGWLDGQQPTSVSCDHHGRVLVRYRDKGVFVVTDQNKLQPIPIAEGTVVAMRADRLQTPRLRDLGNASRALHPFAHQRTWHAKSGGSVNAVCTSLNDTHAQLTTSDGRLVTVKRNDLSGKDRQFFEDLDWYKRPRQPDPESLQVLSRFRTRRGSFTNWNDLPDAEKAKVLPRVNDVSIAPNQSQIQSAYFATARGLEQWTSSGLAIVAAAPDDVGEMSGGEVAPLAELLALEDGSVLGMFRGDKRVFQWSGDRWQVTIGSDSFEISNLTRVGKDVFALTRTPRDVKPTRFGVAKFLNSRQWEMAIEYRADDKASVYTPMQITALGDEQFMVTWSEYMPLSTDFSDPGSTVFTFHTVTERGKMTQGQLHAAQRHEGHYINRLSVLIHGVLMAKSTTPVPRIIRWARDAPVSTAIVETLDTNRYWANAADVVVSPDGAVWSIAAGVLTRIDDHTVSSINIDDATATSIDIVADGSAIVQGTYLTVVEVSKPVSKPD